MYHDSGRLSVCVCRRAGEVVTGKFGPHFSRAGGNEGDYWVCVENTLQATTPHSPISIFIYLSLSLSFSLVLRGQKLMRVFEEMER